MIRHSDTDPGGKTDRVVVYVCSDESDPDDNDDDNVVVIGEFDPKSKSRRMKVGCDDDESLVLDGDPDMPVLVRCDPCHDVQVVCRDYPHARHDCAKFPFRTTPLKKHCNLYHCYVCDSLAPCTGWDMGRLDRDHCHATDRDEDWKAHRKTSIPGKSIPAELTMQMNGLKVYRGSMLDFELGLLLAVRVFYYSFETAYQAIFYSSLDLWDVGKLL